MSDNLVCFVCCRGKLDSCVWCYDNLYMIKWVSGGKNIGHIVTKWVSVRENGKNIGEVGEIGGKFIGQLETRTHTRTYSSFANLNITLCYAAYNNV